MKKILFGFFLLLAFYAADAQTDSLEQYTGKFKFPDGSAVSEITVVLEGGVLTGSSPMGSSEFRKTDTKDVFDIVAYSGTATFRRGDDGKVKMLRVQVQDIDIEGTKQEGIAGPVSLSLYPHWLSKGVHSTRFFDPAHF